MVEKRGSFDHIRPQVERSTSEPAGDLDLPAALGCSRLQRQPIERRDVGGHPDEQVAASVVPHTCGVGFAAQLPAQARHEDAHIAAPRAP